MYQLQYYSQQMAANARMGQQQNPSASPAPMNAAVAQAAAAAAQRNSPMIATQQLAARSPMPQHQPSQQMPHPGQQFNYAAMNQYNQMRAAAAAGHAPHGQLMPHHMVNGAAANAAAGQSGQATQDQQVHPTAQMVASYQAAHMFNMNYPQMQMNMGVGGMPRAGVPAGYWSVGVGRGMPMANGQHQMPGMAGHPQQLGTAGKAGGMQGS